jgi:hypothetical protein
MDESKRQAAQFLEKEIKTYKALALFLSKEEVKKHLRARDREGLIRSITRKGCERPRSLYVNSENQFRVTDYTIDTNAAQPDRLGCWARGW